MLLTRRLLPSPSDRKCGFRLSSAVEQRVPLAVIAPAAQVEGTVPVSRAIRADQVVIAQLERPTRKTLQHQYRRQMFHRNPESRTVGGNDGRFPIAGLS